MLQAKNWKEDPPSAYGVKILFCSLLALKNHFVCFTCHLLAPLFLKILASPYKLFFGRYFLLFICPSLASFSVENTSYFIKAPLSFLHEFLLPQFSIERGLSPLMSHLILFSCNSLALLSSKKGLAFSKGSFYPWLSFLSTFSI